MAIFSFFATAASSATAWLAGIGLSKAVAVGIVQVGRGLLMALGSAILTPRPPRQQVQAQINQAAAPRIRAYGTVMLGGVRAIFEATGGNLHQIVAAHHGALHDVLEFRIDGETVTLDGSGMVTGDAPAADHCWIDWITSGDGGNYAAVRSAFPSIWTTDHKLTGIATYHVRMKGPKPEKLSKVFPKMAQTLVQMVAEASEVYDPRTETTGWTENAALIMRDYVISQDGMRVPARWLDDVAWSDYADLCDEIPTGTAAPRYLAAGYYSLEDEPKNVLAGIGQACDAGLYLTPEGTIAPMGGEWTEPDVTIGPSDILSISIADGPDEMETFNVIKGIYISPDHGFQPTDTREWRDEALLAVYPRKVQRLEMPWVPDNGQAQRLMKISRARDNPQYTGQMRTNLVGLKARWPKGRGVHTIRIVYPDLDIDDIVLVTSHSYSVKDRICDIGFQSIWNAWAWNAETEEYPPPPTHDDLRYSRAPVDPPTGLIASVQPVTLTGGVTGASLSLTVTDPGNDTLVLVAEFRETPAGPWQPMTTLSGVYVASSSVVDDGSEYELRARWAGRDTWSSSVTITVVADTTAPVSPTGLGAVNDAGTVTVSWGNPAANFQSARVWRGTTTTFGDATQIATVFGTAGQTSFYNDEPGVGTWRYFVTAVNSSGVSSDPAGPESVTV